MVDQCPQETDTTRGEVNGVTSGLDECARSTQRCTIASNELETSYPVSVWLTISRSRGPNAAHDKKGCHGGNPSYRIGGIRTPSKNCPE